MDICPLNDFSAFPPYVKLHSVKCHFDLLISKHTILILYIYILVDLIEMETQHIIYS